MRAFPVAGVQMHVCHGHDNIPVMRHKLDVIIHCFPWVEMVVFSELAPFGASMHHAVELPGPEEDQLRDMVRKHSVWLIPGSVFEKKDGKIYNTAPVIIPQGDVIARYRKMFPFRPNEKGVTGGTEFVTWDVPDIGRFGISICYDMWFPETTRTLAAMGAEMIIHPSLTDTIDRDVALSIARASAAMNQCSFFDVNGVGDGGNGRSIVVRPTGTVVYTAGSGEEVIPVDIDLNVVRRGRATGLFGLGQLLKSFRDREVDFSVYHPNGPGREYLEKLGPLVAPERRSIAARTD